MSSLYIEENNQIINTKELQQQGYTDIHFKGFHLLGGSESTLPNTECFFGTLDSKDSNLGLDTLKPIYHLLDGSDSKNLQLIIPPPSKF